MAKTLGDRVDRLEDWWEGFRAEWSRALYRLDENDQWRRRVTAAAVALLTSALAGVIAGLLKK